MIADIFIRAMRADDWPAVRDIYQAGIATGRVTFETSTPGWQHWDHTHLADHRLIAIVGGQVTGWAALSPVSDRCVYGGVAENSIYIDPDNRGRGVGRILLADHIIRSSRDLDGPNRDLSREHRKRRPPSTMRVPDHRHTRTRRTTQRHLARHPAPRTPKCSRWRLTLDSAAASPAASSDTTSAILSALTFEGGAEVGREVISLGSSVVESTCMR